MVFKHETDAEVLQEQLREVTQRYDVAIDYLFHHRLNEVALCFQTDILRNNVSDLDRERQVLRHFMVDAPVFNVRIV